MNTAVITNVQKSAVEAYFHMLQNRDTLKLSPEIILLAISVIGDYYPIYSSIMSSTITGNDILTLFSNVLENYLNDVDILFLTLMMVKTLIIHCIDITMVDFSSSLKRCMESLHPSVRQGAYELFYVIKNIYNIKGSCSTKSAECDAELFDWTLSFLDSYVIKSLECGSDPYKPLSMRGKKTEFNNMDLRSPEFDSHQFDVLWTTTSISSSRHGPHTSVSTPSISSENAPADSHTKYDLIIVFILKENNVTSMYFFFIFSKA